MTRKVTYRLKDNGKMFSLSSLNLNLVLDGRPWDVQGWSGSADMLEMLRRHNPDVEFIEEPEKSK